jgi:hypothetical protein
LGCGPTIKKIGDNSYEISNASKEEYYDTIKKLCPKGYKELEPPRITVMYQTTPSMQQTTPGMYQTIPGGSTPFGETYSGTVICTEGQ